jgi:hypothetical protein
MCDSQEGALLVVQRRAVVSSCLTFYGFGDSVAQEHGAPELSEDGDGAGGTE